VADVLNAASEIDTKVEPVRAADVEQPAKLSKWYRWRKDGTALMSLPAGQRGAYLRLQRGGQRDSVVHSLHRAALHTLPVGLSFECDEGTWSTTW
jgi:hypothetical protein